MVRQGIQIVLDNPHRELRGAYSLAKLLKEKGIPAWIVSKALAVKAFSLYKPAIIVLPRATEIMGNFAHQAAQEATVCVIPCEHGSGFKEKVISHMTGRRSDGLITNHALDDLTRIYMPGPNQRDWLAETGEVDSDRMLVTGTLNSDHWLLSHDRDPDRFKVGIATSNKSLVFGTDNHSVAKLVYESRTEDLSRDMWRVDTLAFEVSHLFILSEFIDRLSSQDIPLELRPHPHEYVENWQRLVKALPPHVTLSRSGRLDTWLSQLSVVISSFSTVSADAVLQGTPAISLDRIIPRKYVDLLPDFKAPLISEFCWRPETLEEAEDLIAKARQGELGLSPNEEAVREFARGNFHFPRERPACHLIADDLERLYDEINAPRGKAGGLLKDLRLGLSYAKEYRANSRRENLYFPWPWMRHLHADVKAFAETLLAKYPV